MARLRAAEVVLLALSVWLCVPKAPALVVRVLPKAEGTASVFLLPVLVPTLTQDPQNFPQTSNHFFEILKGGRIHIDLELLPSKRRPRDRQVQLSQGTLTNDVKAKVEGEKREGALSWFSGIEVRLSRDLVPPSKGALMSLLGEPAFSSEGEEIGGAVWQELGQSDARLGHARESQRRLEEMPLLGENTTESEGVYLVVMTLEQWNAVRESVLNSRGSFAPNRLLWNSYLKSYLRVPINNRISFSSSVETGGRLLLFVLNGGNRSIRMQGSIQLLNPGGEHLSAEQFPLGTATFGSMMLYLATVTGIMILLSTLWREQKNPTHVLMVANLVAKVLYLLLDSYNVVAFSREGQLETLHWVLPRMLAKIQDILALSLCLLLALGWRVYRSTLTLLEVRFCAGICVLSFYLGVFEVSIGGFQVSRYILHALAYLCIIVAINFNIALLGSSLVDMGLTMTTANTYRRYEAYRMFRWIFVLFILKPTLLLFYKLTVLGESNENNWLLGLADGLIDCGIYVAIFWAFRPAGAFRLFKEVVCVTPEGVETTGNATPPIAVGDAGNMEVPLVGTDTQPSATTSDGAT